MEETINTFEQQGLKGLPLRITFKGQDFEIRILQKIHSKNVTEISIFLDGIVQKIEYRNGNWYFSGTEDDKEFANDIGRAISLRYRLRV